MADDDEYLPGCKFHPCSILDCEDIEEYEPGGFHPVTLEDQYDDNRYQVIHKLGAGGFSTVWLARDLQAGRWVGLKFIIAAESEGYSARSSAILEDPVLASSEFVVKTERRFWVNGPNGRHLCLVMPLVGPNLAKLSDGILSRIKPSLVARLSRQAAEVMALLHSRDKCHGGTFSPFVNAPSHEVREIDHQDRLHSEQSRLALSTDVQSYGTDDMSRVFGRPETCRIIPCFEEQASPGPHAPRYVVEPIDFCAPDIPVLTTQIRILDFDQCFTCDDSAPRQRPGTPAKYMAPEVIAGGPPSKTSDVWSLGCTIFRLRAGFDVFAGWDTRYPTDALQEIQSYLGDLPDDLARAWYDEVGYATEEESGTPLTYWFKRRSLGETIAGIWDDPPSRTMSSNGEVDTAEYAPPSPPSTSLYPDDARMVMPYSTVCESMLWKPTAVRVDGQFHLECEEGEHPHRGARAFPRIGTEEAELLGDLLSRIFFYDSSRRITVQEVLEHPWIVKYGGVSAEDA